jgi:hypothetical protein
MDAGCWLLDAGRWMRMDDGLIIEAVKLEQKARLKTRCRPLYSLA